MALISSRFVVPFPGRKDQRDFLADVFVEELRGLEEIVL